MQEHLQFSDDQKTLDALLYEAQMMTIMTDSESDVVLTKREEKGWIAHIDFSLPNHPLLHYINTKKTNTLSSIKKVQQEETGIVHIKILPSFGDLNCKTIEITSYKGAKKECGLALLHPLQEKEHPHIDDSLLRSLEKNT
jgi:hypothetical protein